MFALGGRLPDFGGVFLAVLPYSREWALRLKAAFDIRYLRADSQRPLHVDW
jgi:hypothetical protein